MYQAKSTLIIAILTLLSANVFSQNVEEYVRVKLQSTASYTFSIRTPANITLQPREGKWLNLKIGEEVKFMKLMKKKPLLVVTAEMENTVIDVSATAKIRNSGDSENIVYINPPKNKMKPISTNNDEYLILTKAEIMPSFKLGPEMLVKYINENLQYPEEAIANNIEGIVVVDFIVDEVGAIAEAKISCDIGHGCGEEALRLINSMPAWNSGLINDEPVVVNTKLPIRFRLNSAETTASFERIRINEPNEPTEWEIRTHSYIRTFTNTHKKVAILPAYVEVVDKKLIKNKKSEPAEIATKENDLSKNFQYAFYEKLLWLSKRGKLKVEIQDIAETNEILIKNDIADISNLVSLSQIEIAALLNVDAVFFADIKVMQMLSKGASALISMATKIDTDADASFLDLQLYDGCAGMPVWKFNQRLANSSLFWKTDKLIELMFKQQMDKKFPYHVKY